MSNPSDLESPFGHTGEASFNMFQLSTTTLLVHFWLYRTFRVLANTSGTGSAPASCCWPIALIAVAPSNGFNLSQDSSGPSCVIPTICFAQNVKLLQAALLRSGIGQHGSHGRLVRIRPYSLIVCTCINVVISNKCICTKDCTGIVHPNPFLPTTLRVDP